MMKTRVLALCLMLAMVLSMAACKKEKDSPAQTTLTETTPAPTTESQTTPATTGITIPVDTNPIVPQDRIEGTYEQWLAAASVQVTTMLMYPECEIQGVYALSETAFEKKMDSKGVVIHITNEGRDIWILSTPLDQERDTAATRDLKASGIGYNTYDEVDASIASGAVQLSLESLEPYIEQTLLPSIYER